MPVSRISIVVLFSAGFSALGTAHADSELRDRYIAATQKMGENMMEVVKACAPDIDTSETDLEYTPKMAESVNCVVETHIERHGRGETVALVEQAEAMAERSFSSLQEMASMQEDYPRLSSPEMLEINQTCGTMEASAESPMSRMLQENMSKLTACFSQQ